jgi:hypothetical protein
VTVKADDVPWYVSFIVSMLPFTLWAFALFWQSRQIRKSLTTKDGRSLADVFAEIAEQMKHADSRRAIKSADET